MHKGSVVNTGYQTAAYQYQPKRTSHYASYTPPKQTTTSIPEVQKGDMVHHTAFGNGMVLSVIKMGGDALLEIAFDQIGTKKMMAKTAFAHMKKL